MKILRNIGLYYLGLTLFSVLLSFWAGLLFFLPLLPFGGIGILCLVLYAFLGRNHKKEGYKIEKYRVGSYIPLYLFPFLFYIAVMWYINRPYKQTVVLPEGYEGVVAIQHDKPRGQEKKWTGGFLGIGASRFIEVDTTGLAETQFTFHHNAIPFLGFEQTGSNRGGLKIYYENDLAHEIVPGADGGYRYTYKNPTKGKPDIYFTGFRYYPLFIFVVTNPEKYHNYFMTEEEKAMLQKIYDIDPYNNYPPNRHELKQEYRKYYELDASYREAMKY